MSHCIITVEQIISRVEAQFKHVAFDPKNNKIYLLTDPYESDGDKDAWFDFADGRPFSVVKNFGPRIRVRKTKGWIYLGAK